MPEEILFAVPATPKYLKHVRTVLRTMLEDGFLASEAAEQFVLAVDEACANRVRHCTQAANLPMSVRVVVTDGEIAVRISPFCSTEASTRIRGRDLEKIRPGGLGTHLMSMGADDVRFETSEPGYMDVVLVKRRNGS